MLAMPVLETERLIIRPFESTDLAPIHSILNAGFGDVPLQERADWLDWTVQNYRMLATLYQPPYGDRAMVLKTTNTLIGSVGLVPGYAPFDTLPYFREQRTEQPTNCFTPAVGLFWVLDEAQQGNGYATEAANAVIAFAFNQLRLKEIIAMTEYENTASIALMERLGMTIERNPLPTPEWFQIVGVLPNPHRA